MTRRLFTSLAAALLLAVRGASAQLPRPPALTREFRGVWATPIWDRGFKDFPSQPGLSTEQQQAELRAMFDRSAAAGLNAVIMHVRMAGDALYRTSFAPWSAYLSGTSGVGPSPAYDPLTFAVDEAHRRGLQLHAWFNPFRALLPIFNGKIAPSHVTRTHPEWIRKYGSQVWIDPGDPAARKFVLETVLDVVKRYDVDGVHIDDYFYPYIESETVRRRVHGKRVAVRVPIAFPDDRTWKKYGRAQGFTSRAAWRRANIDDFIRDLYKEVKAARPSVVVGISPFGIWRPNNPPGVHGLDAYDEIYADSKKWLAQGWLDYLAPQLYWEIGGVQDRFRLLDAWWRTVNPEHRYIWPALYTSRVYGGDAWPMGEIRRQVADVRDTRLGSTDVPGEVHFRLGALFADNNRLAADLVSSVYAERAVPPAYPWLGAAVPAQPRVSLIQTNGAESFTITPGDPTPVRWWVIQTHGRDGRWATTVRLAGEGKVGAEAFGTNDPDLIAVTALSATGVASSAALVAR